MFLEDDAFIDDDFAYAAHGRDFVHDVEHDFFDDGAQTSCAAFSADGFANDSFSGVFCDGELDIIEFKEPFILTQDTVFGFPHDIEQCGFVEVIECDDDGDTAHEFGDESVFNDIDGFDLSAEFDIVVGRFGDGFVVESEAADTDSVLNDAADIIESA